MKLHLPTALRRALLKVMAVSFFVTTGSASATWTPTDDLGKTMFVGDSITNGAYLNFSSWRWEMHKILTDNGIKYNEVGVVDGDFKGGSTNMRYGNSVFLNRHASQNSARAYEIAERRKAGRFGNTGIQHWLDLPEPDSWTGDKADTAHVLSEGDKPVETFFLLIGTNDLLSDGSAVHSDLSTKEEGLIGRSVQNGQVSWSGNSDMDTILGAMLESNPSAQIVILTVPTWGKHNNNNTAADYQAVEEYNKHLAEWVKHRGDDNVVLVDINAGLVDVASDVAGQGVDSFFYNASDGRQSIDHLHPTAQGELLLAGNVAKGLGYAGRTAGQVRKAATVFSLQAQAIHNGATSKEGVTYVEGTGLTFATGASLTGNWTAAPEGGFTLEFETSGGIGDGAANGWDTTTGFTVSLGDGTHSGSLTLNEAYIKWGDNILYSMDMSKLSDTIRIAYVWGNSARGLPSGFYVWLGDQLIGEALAVGSESVDGVKIENTTTGSVTLGDLAMDSTGSWAPSTTGYYNQKPDAIPTIDPASGVYSDYPGIEPWVAASDMVEETLTLNDQNGIQGSLNGKKGATVQALGTNVALAKGCNQDLYVDLAANSNVTNFSEFSSGNMTGDAYVRFLGGTYSVWFGVNGGNLTGDLYFEFSPQADATITLGHGHFTFARYHADETYESAWKEMSLSAFYNSTTTIPKITGEVRYVLNGGTFTGCIYGGLLFADATEETVVEGGVKIFINGGTFGGNIYAGGTNGYIASSEITITGGLGITNLSNVTRISAGGFGINGDAHTGGVAHGGTSTVTLRNITDSDGFASWTGELSGGRTDFDDVKRSLVLDNVQIKQWKATLADFDSVDVMNSNLTLNQLGGAKELEVGGGSTLTLTVEGSDGGTYTGMTTLNGGTIVLESGVSYTTRTAAIDDDQEAASTVGVYDVKGGATLALSAGENPNTQAKEVRGNVEVRLEGGVLNLGEGAADAPNDTVSLSKIVLSGGESTLNVTGAWTLKGLEGSTASKLTIGGEGGSLGFSMESSLAGPVTLHFGSGVNYSGVLRVDGGSATAESHVLLEIGDILTTLVGARAGEGLTIELTGLGDKDLLWGGFQLFSTGGSTALTEAQITALKGLLSGEVASGYGLGLRADGTVFLQRDAAADLTWAPGGQSSPTWAEGNETTWSTDAPDKHFASGDNVIFAKLGDAESTTVAVSGTVHVGNITVGTDDTAANYILGETAATDDVIDLAGDITLEANSTVTFNADVRLSGADPEVTGTGHVTFGKLTGETLKLETSEGGSLVVGLSDMANVTVGTAGLGDANARGGIELGAGTTLRLEHFHTLTQGENAWKGGFIFGDGTLDIALGGQYTQGNDDNGLLWHLVRNYIETDAATAAASLLGTLKLSNNTHIIDNASGWSGHDTNGGTGNRGGSVWGHIKNIVVEAGSCLEIKGAAWLSGNVGKWSNWTHHTYTIAGAGDTKATSESTKAALSFDFGGTGSWVLPGDLILGEVGGEKSATVYNNCAVSVTGTYDAGGGTLTKTGTGSLTLTKVKTGANAGALTVNGGTVEITGLADDAGTETKVATTVNLQDAEGDGTGTFKVSGSANYSVGKVVFGQGAEAEGKASLTSSAVLEVGAGTTLTVAGEGGTALDFGGGAGIVKGAGTVVLGGGVTGGGAMGIDSATVEANAEWTDYTGGLYLTNGSTLKLGADIQVGYFGGTGNAAGGVIELKDGGGQSHTIKVVGSGNAAVVGMDFGTGVTLELAEGSVQNFGEETHIAALTGSGALGVQGGNGESPTVTVDTLSGYTGDIHLYVDGTEGHAVLQLGGGATLNKVVLEQGGGGLRLGQGTWTLKTLDVGAAPTGAGNASQLHISAVGAAAETRAEAGGKPTLTFGDGNGSGLVLGEHVELTLGGGIEYSGTIVVDARNGANGSRLFGVEDVGVLEGTELRLKLRLSATDLADLESWAGLQLFGENLEVSEKEALIGIIELENGALEEWQHWDISVNGLLTVTRGNGDLYWEATGETWQNKGDTKWTIGGGEEEVTFQDGDSVTFGPDGKTTVEVEGTVAPKNVTFGGAAYTFNAKEDGADDSIAIGGNLIVGGTGSSATFNVPVTFSKEGGASITGTGVVTFGGNISGNGAGLTIGDGEKATEVHITNAGEKNLGNVDVQANATLVIEGGALGNGLNTGSASWGVGSAVGGAGTVRLAKGAGQAGPIVLGLGNSGNNFLNVLLGGNKPGRTLGRLEVGDGVFLDVETANATLVGPLQAINEIWVTDGGGLRVRQGTAMSAKRTGGNNALHIAGDGDGTTTSFNNNNTGQNAALAVEAADVSIGWDVYLEGDAVISAGGHTMALTELFDAKTHNLVKVGNSVLTLNKVSADSVGSTERVHAGAITVNGGTVEISGLAGEGETAGVVATTVDLRDANGDGTGTFKVSGNVNYGVGKVLFGQGTEAANTASLASSAVVETAEGTTLTVAGEGGVSLDFAGGAGRVQGAGTVVLEGGVTGSGAMGIDGATVVADAAWSGYTGGLYLVNGTLQLGADVEVGYLGGTTGGNILVKEGDSAEGGHSVTLTSTRQAGAASNLNLGEGVTLKLADGTAADSRVKQTLTHLQGSGNLEVGAYGQLFMTGTGETGNTAGSLTLNGGELHLYDGTHAVTLDLSGDVTSTGDGACIYVGYGQKANSPDTALNVQGNMTLGGADTSNRLFYQHNGSTVVEGNLALNADTDAEAETSVQKRLSVLGGSFTVGGSVTGTGAAAIEIGGATLHVQGRNAEDETNILGELQFHAAASALNLGTDTDEGYLIVGGVRGQTTASGDALQQKVTGRGTLEVRVAGDTVVDSNDATGDRAADNHLKLKLEGEVTLKKTGEGTWKLYYLDASAGTTHVLVNGGTLEVAQGNVGASTFSVADLQVDGGSAVLDFSRATLQYAEGKNNLTLSHGGTLRSSYSGGGNADYSFGRLSVGEGGGKIESSDGAGGMKDYHFDSLSGEGDLDLTAALKGTRDATRHSLNLGHISGYTGTVSAGTLDENNVLSIDGEIEAGAAGTTGSITATEGAVTLNGSDAVLRKSGEGGFNISGLRIGSGQGLQVDYAGGKLGIDHLVLEDGASLNYTAAAAGTGAQLVELAFSDFVTLFGSHGAINLVTDSGIERGGEQEWFYLGIVAGSEEEIGAWSADVLQDYFIDDYTGDGAILEWQADENGRQKLYLSLLSTEEAVRYWDRTWDDGSGTGSNGTRGNGPSNRQMDRHADLWYSTDESGNVDTTCAWSQMGDRMNSSTDFTQSTLQLGGDDGKWRSLGMNYVRLSKGSSSETTRLSVLGGKLYNDGDAGEKLSVRTYISLWAPEAEHFHLLVGGSSYVGRNVTASGGLGFSGNTHIQVQGGTVDHIVGGNHVTNSAATFTGNTYISVYEGGSAHNEQGVPDMEHLDDNYGTSVRGGIVGGSTVTATSGNLNTKTYDFLGHSHIFIYTVLKSANALAISDGDKNPGNDVTLYNVVGGNAWIGLMPTAAQNMVFSGSSNITIDLSQYQNYYHESAVRGGLTFEKAIVGGNYSSTGVSSETGTQTRSTVFEYNSQGQAAEHPYAVQIEITGMTGGGEAITFLGGINGASRRDSTGDGATTFDASGSRGILLDLIGGVYRNYVAGGFWFGGSRYGAGTGREASYTGRLVSDIAVNLNGGEYWRVIGGSVNFDGNARSSCTTTGNTVVTVKGAVSFGMAKQGQAGEQAEQPTQANLGLLLGGSLYSDTRGTFVQEGSTTLNVKGGTYDNTHIVAGDYMVYTDSDRKENSASITGGTKLVLGGDGSDLEVTSGIVVAGSYLSDTGIGGSVSVGPGVEPGTQVAEDTGEGSESVLATQVTVKKGVKLNPMANHKVVLVGGNLLLDDGAAESQGGHTVTVNGDTQITVEGGTINGYIVGGSYTNNSATGQNTLETTGTISIDIRGGTVNGNVFGGHFSENTSSPDRLILHDVNITMSGGAVNGYIFGGSLRKATSSLAEGAHPTQGDVLIQLTGGSVGGVYAAGDHYNTAGGAELHVRTNSTRVELGSGVKLALDAQSGEGDQYIVVSGGYLRSADAATRANDFSTVGYDEATKTWADECAVLSFTDNPAAYGNLQGTKLRFQDFDAVEVKEGTLVLEGSQLAVMHKVADRGVTGNDSFAKMGAGSLVLGGGLRSFHGQDANDVADFAGKIILDGGTLTLGGGGAQSLTGGLQVNMAGRKPGNAGDAFLQVLDDGTSFTIGELSASNKMEITLEYKAEMVESLKTGVYYIADGLVGLNPDTLKKYVEEKYIELNLWEGALEGDRYDWHLELRGENNEQLVLRVQNNDPNSWVWEGDEGGEWKPGDNSNWTHGEVEEGDESYKSDTFYFNSGADTSGDVRVASGIDISEGKIVVENGQYRFVQPENVDGNYEGLKVGTLQVGEEGGGEPADVELALPTGHIGFVELHDNGRLSLAHGQAIQGDTQLKFLGNGEGILKYAEDENGHLLYTSDLSGQVSSESASSTVLHIQVGDGAMDGKETSDAGQSGGEGVTWAGGKDKQGIKFAVENGIIKTGYKNFTLRLTDAENAYTGTIEAREGKLTIEAAGVDIAASGGTEDAEGTVEAKLEVSALATLELVATGGGSGVTVSRAVSGAGTLSIGTAAKNQGDYTLAAAVAGDFTGTVRLVGDGTGSTVNVKDTAALGNAQSTLAMAGRAIVLSGAEATPAAEGTATVSVAAITVEGTNYVGGYGAPSDDVNKAITLKAANSITGNAGAVLANAQGGYTHTLEGDLSGFTGAIAAGVATDSGVATAAETAPEATAPQEPAAPQSTWTLGGALTPAEGSTSYTLAAKLAGTGKITLNYALSGATAGNPGKVLLTGDIGDATLGQSVSVEHAMSGTVLVLAGQNNTSTGDLIFDGNEIWLGDESHTSRWDGGVTAGSDAGARSRFVLRNGVLGKAVETPGVALAVDTAARAAGSGEKTVVDAGGTMGSRFDEIVINDGGHLSGVEGDITVGSGDGQTRLVLYFGQGNYGDGVSDNTADYLMETTGDLVIAEVQGLYQDGPEDDLKDEAAFVLDFSNEGLFDLLKRHHDEGARSYLHVLSGGSIFFDSDETEAQLRELLRTGTYSKLLYGLSFTLASDGGDLVLRGSSSDIYLVLTDESDPQGNKHTVNTVEDAAVLAEKKATLLDRGTVLTVELGEGKAGETVTVHNLVGLSGTALEASGAGTVLLDNTEVLPDPVETDPWVSDKVDDPDGQYLGKLKGQDTYFDGMLRSADTQTQFVKSGAGTLTVGDGTENGGVNIAGELRLEDGDFTVRGGENGAVGTLTFAYGEGSEHRKGFTVQGGKVTVGVISETGGGVVTVEQQGTFAFVGDSTATGTVPGNLRFTGSGTLEIGGDEDGGKLALGGTSGVAGVNVRVRENSALSLRDNAALEVGTVEMSENGELDLSGAAHGVLHTVGTLTDNSEGTGILRGGANTDLTVKSGAFSGTLAGGGKLTVAANNAFSLERVKTDATAPSGAWGITVQRGGTLTLDTTEQHGDAGPVFGDVVFGDDAHITLRMDYNADGGSTARMHTLNIGDGVVLTLESVSTNAYSGTDQRVRIGYAEVEGAVGENVQVELKGVSFLHFEKAGDVVYEDGAYYVDAKQVTENKFERALPSMEKNAQAGAALFWSASAPSKSEALAGVLANPNSDLYLMLLGLTEMLENNAPGLANTLAAGAGASISVLGPALAEDIHRQLVSMRNRTTTLTEDLPTDGYDAFPYWHAWITGEGGYHKLDADGFAPGYTLNNWGGSVGVDANVSPRTSVGLALTAMYGDLDTESADSTSGNIDTVYLSGFLRHAVGSWSHTIALSVGVADVKLDRTVNYGIGSYRTHGSTDGLAFGLLYEVGYTKFVNKRGTFAVQPIVNVELRHALIDGYTESGSDAGLKVDDIEQTVLTFGAGVRVQGLVGEHAFNNAATLEARALVKTDVGDRTGTSQHTLIHDTTQAEVESAEVGAVGVETGVGLSIPLGRNVGSILLDGSVEFRSGWTSANASVGYRINF